MPCKYCKFDLWQLLNYRLVDLALQDMNIYTEKRKNKVVGIAHTDSDSS